MIAAGLTLLCLFVIGLVVAELLELREQRLERINQESWELLRASRKIHDETAQALQDLFEEARSNATSSLKSGIDR